MAVSPGREVLMTPRGETSAMASSLVRKSHRGVMFSVEPSAKVAKTLRAPDWPGLVKAYSDGVIWTDLTEPEPGERVAPWAIQVRRRLYCQEDLPKRVWPPCWDWPVALRRTRERSGSLRSMRRPLLSRTMAWKSL